MHKSNLHRMKVKYNCVVRHSIFLAQVAFPSDLRWKTACLERLFQSFKDYELLVRHDLSKCPKLRIIVQIRREYEISISLNVDRHIGFEKKAPIRWKKTVYISKFISHVINVSCDGYYCVTLKFIVYLLHIAIIK